MVCARNFNLDSCEVREEISDCFMYLSGCEALLGFIRGVLCVYGGFNLCVTEGPAIARPAETKLN